MVGVLAVSTRWTTLPLTPGFLLVNVALMLVFGPGFLMVMWYPLSFALLYFGMRDQPGVHIDEVSDSLP
jgi:hypothetical protein